MDRRAAYALPEADRQAPGPINEKGTDDMKYRYLMLAAAMLLLSGCGKQGGGKMDEALAYRASLLSAGGCSFRAEITADYGETVLPFAAQCQAEEESVSFTLLEPESIRGITGSVEGKTGKLTFDGQAVSFGTLVDGTVSPAAAPYVLCQSWREGYISAVGQDDAGLRMTVNGTYAGNDLITDTWLDPEKGVPFCAEVCYNGQRILSVQISEFQFGSAE